MSELKVCCPTCGHLLDCQNVQDIVQKLEQLGKVEIKYSELTKMFYVDIDNVDIGSNYTIHGIVEHRATPEEAIKAYFNYIINLRYDECIVVGSWFEDRKEYKYKNGEFVLVE